MTIYKVPYTFVPGTKAKASEVNANFSAVLDFVESTNDNCLSKDFSNLTEEGKKAIYNNSSGAKIPGEIITSMVPLDDPALRLLDGSKVIGGGVNSGFVEYIAELYDSYPDLFCTEDEWQAAESEYGVCGKFVYDETADTVRLPKITGIISGTTDVSALGDLIEAGLPNITGQFGHVVDGDTCPATGAFQQVFQGNYHDGGGDDNWSVNFDASRSSSIYGNADTVQPQVIKILYYIVVASRVKLDVTIDLDEVATDLNQKADTSLSNLSVEGASVIGKHCTPSNDFVELQVLASGASYTAPGIGYFYADYIMTQSGTTGSYFVEVYVNDVKTIGAGHSFTPSYKPAGVPLLSPLLNKNDKVVITYSPGYLTNFKFVYTKGTKEEE